jgi:hypothetical protein
MLRPPTERPAEGPQRRTRVKSHTYCVPTVREIPRPAGTDALYSLGW